MTMAFDQAADRVLDVILEHGGTFDIGDPGEVLGNLATEAEVPYKELSLVVLRLERMEWVHVERLDTPEARRANRIISISVL